MADKANNIDIPEGYVVDDFDDELREMGLNEEQVKKFNKDMDESLSKINDEIGGEPLPPEKQRLYDIIYSPDTTWEEKEAARHELNPEMYDENGNLILDDGEFFDRIEADMKRCYEEMKRKGLAI